MKYFHCLPLLAVLPLGCAASVPATVEVAAVAPAQRPADVTVVDLTPPAPKAPAPAAAPAPKTAEELQADRQSALKQAADYGMIGLLSTGGGDPNAPTAPWGKDDGTDPNAKGNMWGDSVGDSFGAGGLGLAGTGPGGGGRGEGIGLGSIGTLGHGAGSGTGQTFGNGSGRLGGSHAGNPPKIKMGATSVTGRLPPEVIQRIVRQNFGRFRLCYENGLRTNAKLEGNVVIRFEIDPTGAVSTTSVTKATTLSDKGVAACVERAFHGLSFPQPEGGKVVVVYPLQFSPADPAPAPAAATPAPAPAAAPPVKSP
jgi:hypothetical protein